MSTVQENLQHVVQKYIVYNKKPTHEVVEGDAVGVESVQSLLITGNQHV